jgi:hypothetical protein
VRSIPHIELQKLHEEDKYQTKDTPNEEAREHMENNDISEQEKEVKKKKNKFFSKKRTKSHNFRCSHTFLPVA